MVGRQRYRKKTPVTAVQLNVDTDGFSYRKWGGTQHCKAGDWLVDSDGDCYTVDRDSFARTYALVSPGVYRKRAAVWAEVATRDGSVATREGRTAYRAGDYLVSNSAGGSDDYAVAKAAFETSYEPADD